VNGVTCTLGSTCTIGPTAFTFTTGTTSIPGGTCVAQTAITSGNVVSGSVTGITTTSQFLQIYPTATLSSVTGWGSGGTLRIQIEPPTANAFQFDICNDDPANSHAPGASVTWRTAWF
jgi:hypothetical protein